MTRIWVYHPRMQILIHESLTHIPNISIKFKLGVVITVDDKHRLSVFREKMLFYMTPTNFLGNHGKITQVIKKCQMSTSLSKILGTSLSKKCYSAVFIKKVNALWMFIEKAFLKTSEPPSSMFSCKISKFFEAVLIKNISFKDHLESCFYFVSIETIQANCIKTCSREIIILQVLLLRTQLTLTLLA